MESFWNKNIENKISFESVKENLNTEVCIIGGGLTGLSIGYYLKDKASFVILEKDEICSSTSSKNTGKVTSQHGIFYDYLYNSNDEEFAKKYFEANEKAIDNIEKIINTENIECDFKRESSYVFVRKEDKIASIKKEEKIVNKLSPNKARILSKTSLPLKIKCAIEFKNQAKINPLKYGYGLANCIIKNGGKIFEKSKATKVEKVGDKFEIEVNNFKIIADKVVLATRYPTINIPGYYFLKMYQSSSYAIVADVKEELFDGHYISLDEPIVSFRVIEENGKKLLLVVGYDYKTGSEQVTNGYRDLENLVKSMYPNAEVLYKWSAEDAISLDKIAYIGDYSNLIKNLYVATGYNKWGLTTSNIAGNIISDKILGKENEYEDIYKSTRLEPIKNRDEMKNMLVETKDSLILSKFKLPKETADTIKNDEGKVVNIDGKKVGVYKSEKGEVFIIKPICSHLGCELNFNNNDKIWECPCHGSKFTYEGKAIEVPGIKDLK